MPTIQVEASLSAETLIEAASQLTQMELDELVGQLMLLRAKRRSSSLSNLETDLFHKINQGIPDNVSHRFKALQNQQENAPLTEAEQEEMHGLINTIENLTAQRIQHLAELASIRKFPVRKLMKELGL